MGPFLALFLVCFWVEDVVCVSLCIAAGGKIQGTAPDSIDNKLEMPGNSRVQVQGTLEDSAIGMVAHWLSRGSPVVPIPGQNNLFTAIPPNKFVFFCHFRGFCWVRSSAEERLDFSEKMNRVVAKEGSEITLKQPVMGKLKVVLSVVPKAGCLSLI